MRGETGRTGLGRGRRAEAEAVWRGRVDLALGLLACCRATPSCLGAGRSRRRLAQRVGEAAALDGSSSSTREMALAEAAVRRRGRRGQEPPLDVLVRQQSRGTDFLLGAA